MKKFLAVLTLLFPVSFAVADVAESIANAKRPPADIARDAGRKPAAVLEFLGLQPGMVTLDLIAAGGYYTEVLSHATGPKGKVLAQNPPRILQFRDGANEKAISQRLVDGRLPNVQRVNSDVDNIGIAPGSVDLAITALNFHDVYNGGGEAQALGLLSVVYGVLKPGGVFGIIDHAGDAGADNASLHSMREEEARAVIAKSKFRISDSSQLLRNPDDDHSKGVFSMRGATDRFLLKLVKPK